VHDARMGPKTARPTVLTAEEEATQTCAATSASVISRRRPVAAHHNCPPSAGRRWRSRCAPRTRPARWCAGSQDRHEAHTAQVGSTGASTSHRRCVDQFVDLVHPHQFAFLLHQAQLQHLGLDLNVISVGLRARRLPPLAPQVSPMRLEAASAHCWSWVWKSQRRRARRRRSPASLFWIGSYQTQRHRSRYEDRRECHGEGKQP
jgi:hypothetical protein